jgi:nitroreductase
MEVMEAIKGRRSIRKYRQTPVTDEALNVILEAARWAPSWANTQCFECIVVRDPELRKRLAETLPEGNPARPAFEQAPVVIVACAQKGKSGFFKGTPATDKGDWLMFDTALALQNLTLAAHAQGLGTVHVGFFDTQKVKEILQVPPAIEVVELLPLGVPDEEGRLTKRRAVEEFVFHDQYGSRRAQP